MATKTQSWLVKAITIVLCICIAVTRIHGTHRNDDQLLGCLVAWVAMTAFAILFFIYGALPFRTLGASDAVIRRAFVIACIALIFSVCQIPLWSWMTHEFPPGTMNDGQATVATVGVLFGLFGPAAPLLVKIGRFIRARNKAQREASRRRKLERNEPET